MPRTTTLCLKKNAQSLAIYNFDKHGLILIIFGEQHHHTFKNNMHIQLSLSLTLFAFK